MAKLSAINKTAGRKMQEWIDKHGIDDIDALVSVAYALTSKYGEAASATACQMYDEIAAMQKAHVPPAEPKAPQHINYVNRAVRDTILRSPSTVPGTVSEMVKRTGAETTLKNAKRDGAYFAWVPNGDTCAFCITLASNGWRRASKKTINGDHAEHIHKNCDCEFAISFNGPGSIEGYDPGKYLAMYEGAEGTSWKDKVNAMRRAHYAANKDVINAQKRAAYAARKNYETALKGFPNGGGGSTINLTREGSQNAPRVPNAITAATIQDKVQKYLLNSNHPVGKHKARVLNSVLGFHYQNWEEFSNQVFDKLQTSSYTEKTITRFGTKYVVPMRIAGKKGKSMVVKTVWQVDNGSNIPRCITMTFDTKTIRNE